jgi:hypothetical protein
MSDTVETWKKRVASWRASGETAEKFSYGRPWSPKTLKWYGSKLRREFADASAPMVRVAQLVRASGRSDPDRGAIVVEAFDARVRITVEAGAPAETVAAVLGIMVPWEGR